MASLPPLMRHSLFLRLWGGSTASGLATWGVVFLLGLAVSEGALSPRSLGVVLALRSVGFLGGVLVGGVLADRVGARPVLFTAGALASAGSALVALGLAGVGGVLLMGGGIVMAGAGQGACRPAYQALVPAVVPLDLRQSANATLSLSLNLALLAAPLVATAAAQGVGVAAALACVPVLWGISALLPPWVRAEAASRVPLSQQIREGIDEARRHPWFFPLLAALSAIIAFGYSVTGVILPIISGGESGGGRLLAIAMTAYTLGGLAGAAVVARVQITRRIPWMCAGLAWFACAPLSLLLPGIVAVPALGYVLTGFGIQLFNILWFTQMQSDVAPDKLARVSSLDFLCSFGLAPLGLALIGPVAELIGITAVLMTSAAICFLAPALAYGLMRSAAPSTLTSKRSSHV